MFKSTSNAKDVIKFIDTLDVSISKSRKQTCKELDRFITSLSKISDFLKNKKEHKVNKVIKRTYNTAYGVLLGITDGDMSVSEASCILDKEKETLCLLKQEAEVFIEERTNKIDNYDELKELFNSMSFEEAKKQIPSISSEPERDSDDKKKLSKIYKKYFHRIPTHTKELFVLTELPIVPVFKDFNLLSPSRLKSLNIPYEKISGFTVLNNQYILFFKRENVDSKEAYKFAENLLSVINEKSPIQLSPVTHIMYKNPNNPKYWMLWVMPNKKLNRLEKFESSQGRQMSGWGFPWNMADSVY